MVTDSDIRIEAIMALFKRYDSLTALTAMDLSVEAEAFGAVIEMSDDEVPSVTERLLTEPEMVAGLEVPD